MRIFIVEKTAYFRKLKFCMNTNPITISALLVPKSNFYNVKIGLLSTHEDFFFFFLQRPQRPSLVIILIRTCLFKIGRRNKKMHTRQKSQEGKAVSI